MASRSGPHSARTTFPYSRRPEHPKSAPIVVVKRAHTVVVGPFFLDDVFIVEIVENLSSRFLMEFGKDRKVWVKDARFGPEIREVSWSSWQHYSDFCTRTTSCRLLARLSRR
jgi:hypothetical protein